MPRVRLGVALLVPPPLATEIEGLRRALEDPVLARIAPHVTLVPPVNVRMDDLGAALAVLRAAAATAQPLDLELGPPRSFEPASPTLYLPVEDDGDSVASLVALRDAVFVPPLLRPVDHEFVPHVTVAAELEPGRSAAGTEALRGFRGRFVADTLTLLRYQPAPSADFVAACFERGIDPGPLHARWVPAADARLRRLAVVGRGGRELELTAGSVLDHEALAVLDAADRSAAAVDWFARPAAHGVPPGARLLVMTARHRGRVMGVGWGHAWSRPDGDTGSGAVAAVVSAPGSEDEGIEHHVEQALESLIAET